MSHAKPVRIRRMILTKRRLLVGVLVLVSAAVSAGGAAGFSSALTPKTGIYKGMTSQGKAISFRIVIAVCPPQERGGNQHQRKGYCFQPVSEPVVIDHCADGTPATSLYPLFSALLTAAGAVTSPEVSSDGSTGTFHLTVSSNGTAKGALEQKEFAFSSTANASIKCPSGNVTFTLRLT